MQGAANANMCLSELVTTIAAVYGDLASGTVLSSGWFDPRTFHARRLLCIVKVDGAAQNDADVVITAQKATLIDGTGAEAIRVGTEPAHATANDNGVFQFDLGPHELDTAKPFIRFIATNGATGQNGTMTVLGGDMRYSPGQDLIAPVVRTFRE